ncbi:MAG: acyl-CoA dehydrogenase family protein, partial [Bacillota bacterium]|nr:acyl-CoA dehydrogenase family protein [Bacillota bacterium]
VYAKVDGEKFTAFIVERDGKGLSVSEEVNKMGIKGSSTRMVFLDDVPVPVENVLGEVGRGAKIAFTILDIGRLKLGVGSLGSQREVQKIAASYAKGREQFGQPIASFPLIQEKLAFMAAEAYALESASYRTTGLLDQRLQGLDAGKATGIVAEFALECSALKVYGSEVLGRTVDEAVQIHGGYGYMQEFAVERAYRDARINRIFEGTNEINRLLIVETLVRQAMAGLPVLQAATDALKGAAAALEAVKSGKGSTWFPQGKGEGPAHELLSLTRAARVLGLALAGQAIQKVGQDLNKEQELVGRLADLILYLFAAESAFLRVAKGHEEGLLPAQVFAHEAGWRMARAAQEAVDILGLEAGWQELALSLADGPVKGLKGLRRSLADKVLSAAP